MKKMLILCLLMLLTIGSVYAHDVMTVKYPVEFAGRDVQLYDSHGNKTQPIILNDTVYIPVRMIENWFSESVTWDVSEKKVLIGKNNDSGINGITIEAYYHGDLERKMIYDFNNHKLKVFRYVKNAENGYEQYTYPMSTVNEEKFFEKIKHTDFLDWNEKYETKTGMAEDYYVVYVDFDNGASKKTAFYGDNCPESDYEVSLAFIELFPWSLPF